MLMIVMSHCSVHSFEFCLLDYCFNKYLIAPFIIGGNLGVVCFVLISSYFILNSKFTISKLVKLIIQIMFYALLFLVCFSTVLEPVDAVNLKSIVESIMPLGFSDYWFMTAHFTLMIFSPVLNMVIGKIDQKIHLRIIVITTIIWSVLPTFIVACYEYNAMIWFVLLYFIATYIRQYIDIQQGHLVIILNVPLLVFSL